MGKAIHEFNVTAIMCAHRDEPVSVIVADRINFILSILPKGAVHVGTNESHDMNNCLSLKYGIVFEHPSFDGYEGAYEAITQIKIDEVRIAWKESDDKIGTDSLFLGIKYLTVTGQNRYPLPA